MTFLLDTDTFVFLARGMKTRHAPTARQRELAQMAARIFDRCRRRKQAGHTLALSAITVAELEFGARESGGYEAEIAGVRGLFAPFSLLDFDATDCAAQYGLVRSALESAGTPIGSLDTLIAAHALAAGATLVTNNTAEFSRVRGLAVENWTQ